MLRVQAYAPVLCVADKSSNNGITHTHDVGSLLLVQTTMHTEYANWAN